MDSSAAIKGCNRIFIKFRNRIGIEYDGKVNPHDCREYIE